MSAEYVDSQMAEQLMWQDESPRPMSVEQAERERIRTAGAGTPSSGPTDAAAPVPAAPGLVSEWPTLLRVLLARLRGEQPFENCFLCLTSDDPRDCCAEHHDRLETIMHYGEAAA